MNEVVRELMMLVSNQLVDDRFYHCVHGGQNMWGTGFGSHYWVVNCISMLNTVIHIHLACVYGFIL